MSLANAINGLNTVMKTITQLVRVYDDPPESINEFPSCITYSREGTMEDNAAGGRSFHTLVADIYIARTVLPQAIDDAKAWPDLVFAAIRADNTFGGAISHIVWDNGLFRYRTGPMRYGGSDALLYGVQFTMTVKINEVGL